MTPSIPDPMTVHRQKQANADLLDALAHRSGPSHMMPAQVQKALDDGADPNVRASRVDHGKGARPLHLAARGGARREIVELLLARGAMIDMGLPNGETALHVAAKKGHVEVVDALLDAGASLSARTKAGQTPLAAALAQRPSNLVMIEHLMARGASLEDLTGCEPHPLHLAARQANVEALRFMLDHGVSPNTRDNQGSLPLGSLRGGIAFERRFFASDRTDSDMLNCLDLLIGAGADVQAQVTPHSGETALSYLLQAQHIPAGVVHRLIEAGSSPYGQAPATDGSNSPVSFSVFHLATRGDVATLKDLFDHGMDPRRVDKFGQSFLHHALDTSSRSDVGTVTQTLELLIAAGADVNARLPQNKNQSPLHDALLLERDGLAAVATQVLLEHGANPSLITGEHGLSPLAVAAMPKVASGQGRVPVGRLALVDLLLEHGADVLGVERKNVPLLFSTAVEMPAAIAEHLLTFARAHRTNPERVASSFMDALEQAGSSRVAAVASHGLPLAFDLGVEPDMMRRVFRTRVTRSMMSASTAEALEPMIQRLEARLLTREIDQATAGTDLTARERHRL